MPKQENNSVENVFDYTRVTEPARVAIYNDLLSAPRIIEVQPNTTTEFIEELTTCVYTQSQQLQGLIPYTVIREVTENFIHAQFSEIVVSILDQGNTIRFSDQGPGITEKEKVQKPGFTSATEPMKQYIRGVGSGLPIVKEYLGFKNGTITIEDNIGTGAAVTISLLQPEARATQQPKTTPHYQLTTKQQAIMKAFTTTDVLGITAIAKQTGIAQSSVSYEVTKLEALGLLERTPEKKRQVTQQGRHILADLQ